VAEAEGRLHRSQAESAGLERDLRSERDRAAHLQREQIADAAAAERLDAVTKQLEQLRFRVGEADRARAEAHAALGAQLRDQAETTRRATDEVQQEARKLTRAMSGTNARGQWGEANLERLVEAAGMIERVHFDTQATLVGMDSAKRPDMIVNLPGGRSIVVDAKVPLNALLAETDVDAYSAVTLQRHAAALKEHIGILAGRDYAQLLPDTPELVVLYLPAESLLSLAVAADAGVLDYAFGKGVALATPNTMLALLRTVNHGWRQESVASNAREIHALGTELHRRLATMSGHLETVGKRLGGAVEAYNKAVGSYETRVLVQTRKFTELDVVGDQLPAPQPVEASPRALSTSVVDLADERPVRAVERGEATA